MNRHFQYYRLWLVSLLKTEAISSFDGVICSIGICVVQFIHGILSLLYQSTRHSVVKVTWGTLRKKRCLSDYSGDYKIRRSHSLVAGRGWAWQVHQQPGQWWGSKQEGGAMLSLTEINFSQELDSKNMLPIASRPPTNTPPSCHHQTNYLQLFYQPLRHQSLKSCMLFETNHF